MLSMFASGFCCCAMIVNIIRGDNGIAMALATAAICNAALGLMTKEEQ